MITLLRTDSENEDFVSLVELLDADLAMRDGIEHSFYNQFNAIDAIRFVVVASINGKACGCGAVKEFAPNIMEVKRMYTQADSRGMGVASRILQALEDWSRELGYQESVLETGKRQPEAIGLYQSNGYIPIPNYGQYIGIENSICFGKKL